MGAHWDDTVDCVDGHANYFFHDSQSGMNFGLCELSLFIVFRSSFSHPVMFSVPNSFAVLPSRVLNSLLDKLRILKNPGKATMNNFLCYH